MSDYTTLAALKKSLNLTTTNTDDDLTLAITAASRAIDEITGRRFYPDADANQVRKFVPVNPGYCIIDDLCQFTSLVAQGSTWTLDTEFYLEPINAGSDARPWTAIRAVTRPFIFTLSDQPVGFGGFDGRVAVTGMWGWATTPAQIQEATMILAGRLMRRVREAPFAVIGTGMDAQAVRIARIDPDVASLVEPFAKNVIV